MEKASKRKLEEYITTNFIKKYNLSCTSYPSSPYLTSPHCEGYNIFNFSFLLIYN